jgi:hypothetical protein
MTSAVGYRKLILMMMRMNQYNRNDIKYDLIYNSSLSNSCHISEVSFAYQVRFLTLIPRISSIIEPDRLYRYRNRYTYTLF